MQPLDAVEGFNLSAFAQLRAPHWSVSASFPGITLRSDPADLFAIPFDGSAPLAADAALDLPAHGGRVNEMLQWIAFDLDAATTYDNRPHAAATSHWGINVWALGTPRDTVPGEEIGIHGHYGRDRVAIWTANRRDGGDRTA